MYKKFAEDNSEAILQLVRDMCRIPAPSHHEDQRAEFCQNWLVANGAKGTYIDEAKNVIFPLCCDGSDKITVFAAHTDTVFPDMEPLPYSEDDEKIYCPGVGDDTASVASLMMLAKYFVTNGIKPEGGVLFVCNACEEGLGNLKGTRQLFKDYEGRIRQFITFDSNLNAISNKCVGSHRYEVEVLTEGGHSYQNFGRKNAINELAHIINTIYSIEVPHIGESRTSYNVGVIRGGTSVNTIAQNAKALCEYRSDNVECLAIMEKKFKEIFANAQTEGVEINVTKVGDRPCGDADSAEIKRMCDIYENIIKDVTGEGVRYGSSSTDCNIPLSLGIPAICVGTNNSNGSHTREEWLDKSSLVPGLEIAVRAAIDIIK